LQKNLVAWKTCITFAQPLIQTLVRLSTSAFLTAIFLQKNLVDWKTCITFVAGKMLMPERVMYPESRRHLIFFAEKFGK
jgi:hypothetical protein